MVLIATAILLEMNVKTTPLGNTAITTPSETGAPLTLSDAAALPMHSVTSALTTPSAPIAPTTP